MNHKIAVIVVGRHYAGKSKTINEYLKAILGIGRRQHKFRLSKQSGTVLSQSREEATKQKGFARSQSLEEARLRNVLKIVKKYSGYDLLVLAAWPNNERPSCLNELRSRLMSAGYRVIVVKVIRGQSERYYKHKARDISNYLRHN